MRDQALHKIVFWHGFGKKEPLDQIAVAGAQETQLFSKGKGKGRVAQQTAADLAKHAQDYDGYIIRADGSVEQIAPISYIIN